MEGFNGFFLERENGKKLKLVTDFVLNKKTYYLFVDGNYYYEENGKATKLDKTSQDGKKIVEKLLSELSSPMMDVIGFDEQRENDTKERIIVEKFKQ